MIQYLKPEQHSPLDAAYKEFFSKLEMAQGWYNLEIFDVVTGYKPHDAFIHYASQNYGFKLAPTTTRQVAWNIEILDEKKYIMFLLQWS